MKIGIISINMFSKGLNFACPLHTYAFQQFLLQNGIESTVITYKPNYYENFNLRQPYDYYRKKYNNRLQKAASVTDPEEQKSCQEVLDKLESKRDLWEPMQKERAVRYDKFQKFINQHYIRTKKCYDSDLLETEDPGFDCYICATDVIWKNTPVYGFDRGYFLGSTCMENKHKIAYSASRGTYFANTQEEVDQFFAYLNDFDAISVREKTLHNYIEQNSDISAPLVLDPVLLHDRSFYEKISIKPPEEHYVLLYYVMEQAKETIRQAALYASAHHQKVIEITDLPVGEGRLKEYPGVDYTLRYAIGIEEWIGYILHADCIFTNSFHVCCFSVLFEKQFFAGHRNSEKVALFMDAFGLSHRKLVSGGNPVSSPPAPIDYDEIRPRLKQRQKESAEWILQAIHQAEVTPRQQHDYSERKKRLTYRVLYNSGSASGKIISTWDTEHGTVKHLSSGTQEYVPAETEKKINDGTSCLDQNRFAWPHYHFVGWKLRIKIDNRWFWYLEDGTLTVKNDAVKQENLKIFNNGEVLPYIPVNQISLMIADAIWKPSWQLKLFWKMRNLFRKIRRKLKKL